MYEIFRLTSPFDDDDDDFAFEEGHAELAAEIREYADDDDDEFDDDEHVGLSTAPPLSVLRRPSTPVRVRPSAKKVPAKPIAAKARATTLPPKSFAVTKAAAKKTGAPKTSAGKLPSSPARKNAPAKRPDRLSSGKKR